MNRIKILRDLEYIAGGLVTLKTLCNREDKIQGRYYDLIEDWNDILYNVIDQLAKEEEDEVCLEPSKNWPQ